jgi:ActR/RegA family two-component response regulator
MLVKKEKKASVLVVEDLKNWQETLSEILEIKYDVQIAASYDEAVAVLQNGKLFQVIIVDPRLEEEDLNKKDGIYLIEHIGDIEEFVNIIVLTAYASIPEAVKALRDLNVFDYVEKNPKGKAFDPQQFLTTVTKAVEDAQRKREGPFAFTLMPFTADFFEIHKELKEAIEETFALACKRADDFFEPRRLMDDIERCIKTAELVVADLTGRNPNVFYEVGLCHGLGQTVFLLTQKIEDVPPDLQDVRLIVYENSLSGVEILKTKLLKAIGEIKSRGKPVCRFEKPQLRRLSKLCFALVPPTDEGRRTFQDIIEPALQEVDKDIECKNARDLFSTGPVINEIWRNINRAQVVIADLTGKYPDVFYETGVSHALGKKVILMARDLEADVPFDLRGRSCIRFADTTFKEGKKARERLTAILRENL